MSVVDAVKRGKEERDAMQVAEDSREETWVHPSFLSELFMGNFNFGLIYPYPEQDPTDKKIGDEYITKILDFLQKTHDPEEVEETHEIKPEVLKGLGELGAFALKIPKQYGGINLSQTNYNRVVHAVASYCSSVGVLLSAHQSIGVPQPLKIFGTKEQKEKYFPRFAKGEISAFALTEPEVGSDPAKMTTTARPTEDGNHWIINGTKLWCTNGTIADIIVVMADSPPKKLPNGKEKKQITAFIVEKTMPGFSVEHRCEFMGLKGIYNGLLKFDNVKVPKENIIWEEGKGLKLALVTLNTGRLTLPAACAAAARACFAWSKTWGKERKQWGASIGEHESSASRLILTGGATYAIDAVSKLCSGLVDRGNADIRIEAAVAKLFTTGAAWRVIDNALQLRGGRGFETSKSLRGRGEDSYPIERLMRDARINTIIEGTSNIQRLFVSREALDKHLQLAGALFNPKASIGAKIGAVVKASLFYSLWYPTRWFHFTFWPMFAHYGSWEGKQMRFLRRMSRKLARTTFHAMALNGPKLEKKQITLGDIVDTGSSLFVVAATLSRYLTRKKSGQLNPGEEEMARFVCEEMASQAKNSYRHIRVLPGKSKVVGMSKKMMEGQYDWLIEDIADVVGYYRANTNKDSQKKAS